MSCDLEIITVEIFKPKSKSFLVNCWYRPSDSSVEIFNNYEELVKKMDFENKEVILIGDFKTAIISPIHKAGCKTECSNYRPISIL